MQTRKELMAKNKQLVDMLGTYQHNTRQQLHAHLAQAKKDRDEAVRVADARAQELEAARKERDGLKATVNALQSASNAQATA